MLESGNRLPVATRMGFLCAWISAMMILQAVAAGQPAAVQAADDEVPGYKVRDPFWPIGTQPPQTEQTPAANTNTQVTVVPAPTKWPDLKMKGTVEVKNGFLVIIEGIGMAEEGQKVSKTEGGYVFTWQVGKITKKNFQYKPLEMKPASAAPKPSTRR